MADTEDGAYEGRPFGEDELVPISALEHYSYCPRQCALIHREQTFDENLYTLRGRAVHERVDMAACETEHGVRVEHSLPLWSASLGLVGKADAVEFRGGAPYPVEYKHAIHSRRHADLQLCAQAMCLEEMTGQPVAKGAVYEHSRRSRREVLFTPALREQVRGAVLEIRRILRSDPLPPVVADRRCARCSLLDSCLPRILGSPARLRALRGQLYVLERSP